MSTVTYNLGPVACIPLGEGRLFETGNTLIAIFRARDGRVYATDPWCPHRGGPLTDGIVAAGKVVCPLHGYTFELATGKPVHNECRAIRTYPVRLNEEDEVLVTMRRGRATAAKETAIDGARMADDASPEEARAAEPGAEESGTADTSMSLAEGTIEDGPVDA
jgi:nitrite reductase (NADH) small subunit